MPWDFYGTFEEGDLRLKNVVTAYTNKNGEKIDRSNSSQLAKGALPLKYGMDPDMKEKTGKAALTWLSIATLMCC